MPSAPSRKCAAWATFTPTQAEHWQQALQAALPDVKAGDRLTGLYQPGQGAVFQINGQAVGAVPRRRLCPPVLRHLALAPDLRARTAPGPAGAARHRTMSTAAPRLTARQGLAYGLLGLPLAFAALPLYVLLPNHYAREYGMPLATLGAVLLAARLLDAVTDPLLGRLSDRLFQRSARAVLAAGAASAVLLCARACGAFFPARAGRARA